MKIPTIIKGDAAVIGLGAVAIIVGLYVLKKTGGTLLNSINPLNGDNVINQAVQSGYQAVTGSTGTIGGDAYGALHDEQGNNVLNPWNTTNVVNQATQHGYQAATGSTGTIGGDVYSAIHDAKGNNLLNPFNWFN